MPCSFFVRDSSVLLIEIQYVLYDLLLPLFVDGINMQMPVLFHTFVLLCFIGGCGDSVVRLPLLANAEQFGSIEVEARLVPTVFVEKLC